MVATLILFLSTLAALLYLLRPRPRRLPPGTQLPDGPPGKPFVGDLLEIPPYHSWFKFTEWSKQYGPLYRLNLAGQNRVIVSEEGIAEELLRERGVVYSSRPRLHMAADLVSDGLRPVFMPYGDAWRNGRKLMHNLTNVSVAATYEPLQEEESLRAVRDLMREPGRYETCYFERYSAGLILRLAYSKPVHTGEESFVRRIIRVVHTVERVAIPSAYLVDVFPSLVYLPIFLAPFKREGKRLHEEELDLFRGLLREGVEASKGATSDSSTMLNFCCKLAPNRDAYDLSDDQVAYVIGTLFEAGAGTTTSAIASFMMAMTLHQEELGKLQRELNSVVGDRIPTFEDLPNLPRVRAVAKEVLRWRPVTAGGLPHMLIRDDVYKMPDGRPVFLEEGTCVHGVQWSIHREEKLYPDSESFRPERSLEPSWPTYKEPLTKFPILQNYSAFGFWRRICPGLNIAERSLYILIARIARSCDITYKRGADGHDIFPPSYDYVAGFNVQPKPFQFELRPRTGMQEIVEEKYRAVWKS